MKNMLYGILFSVLIVTIVIMAIYGIFFKVYEHIEEQQAVYTDIVYTGYARKEVEITEPFLMQLRKDVYWSISSNSESIPVNRQNEIWGLCCSLPRGTTYNIMLWELLKPLREKYNAIYKPIPVGEWNSAVTFCRRKIYRIVLEDIDEQLESMKRDELEKQRVIEETRQRIILEKQRKEEQAQREIESRKQLEKKNLEMKARELEYLAQEAKEKKEREAIEAAIKEKKAIEAAMEESAKKAQKEIQRKRLNAAIVSLEEKLSEAEKANTKRINRIAYLEKRLVDTQEVDTMRNPNPTDVVNRNLWRLELRKLQDDYTYREKKRALKLELNRLKNQLPLQDDNPIPKAESSLGVTSKQCVSKVSIDIPSGTSLIKALYMIALKDSIRIDTHLIKIDEVLHSNISIKDMSPIAALKIIAAKNGYCFSKGNNMIVFRKK